MSRCHAWEVTISVLICGTCSTPSSVLLWLQPPIPASAPWPFTDKYCVPHSRLYIYWQQFVFNILTPHCVCHDETPKSLYINPFLQLCSKEKVRFSTTDLAVELPFGKIKSSNQQLNAADAPTKHQAVSLQFSRWPYNDPTKISPSQTCCILSVTFSYLPLTGSACIRSRSDYFSPCQLTLTSPVIHLFPMWYFPSPISLVVSAEPPSICLCRGQTHPKWLHFMLTLG